MSGDSGFIWTVEAGHTALKWHSYREVSQLGHDSAERSAVVWESLATQRLVWEDLKTFDPLERAARLVSFLEPAFRQTEEEHGRALRGGIAFTADHFLKPDVLCDVFNRLSIAPQQGWQVVTVQTVLRHLASFNVVFSYDEPQTLGLDRLLNALAVVQTSDVPTFVISAGTAITLDAMIPASDGNGWTFCAGAILPGLALMRHALSDILPVPMPLENSQLPAKNTSDSLSNGLRFLLKGALTQALSSILSTIPSVFPCFQVILGGGDTVTLHPLLSEALASLRADASENHDVAFSLSVVQDWTSQGVAWAMMSESEWGVGLTGG